jgi:hypothetical protein
MVLKCYVEILKRYATFIKFIFCCGQVVVGAGNRDYWGDLSKAYYIYSMNILKAASKKHL